MTTKVLGSVAGVYKSTSTITSVDTTTVSYTFASTLPTTAAGYTEVVLIPSDGTTADFYKFGVSYTEGGTLAIHDIVASASFTLAVVDANTISIENVSGGDIDFNWVAREVSK